jgi:hypothetical protein
MSQMCQFCGNLVDAGDSLQSPSGAEISGEGHSDSAWGAAHWHCLIQVVRTLQRQILLAAQSPPDPPPKPVPVPMPALTLDDDDF